MRNTILASGSFASGALFMFFILSGIQTSTTAQTPVAMPWAIPVVPPLADNRISIRWSNGRQQLDGLECEKCVLDKMTFEYSGGAFRLQDCKFSDTVDIELKGAAMNTFILLQHLSDLIPPPAKNLPLHLAFTKPTNVSATAVNVTMKQ